MRHKFQSTFKDGNGRVVGTATTSDGVAGTISIYLAGTTTVASVYTASSGGTAVNSVSTDTHGHFYFWIDENDYTIPQKFKIILSHSDFESKTYDNLDILKVSAATTSLAGIVELDTGAETIAGTDTARAVTADGLAYTLQRGTMQYVADTAANDTYVATLIPAIDAYVDGMVIHFKAKTANTGACTLNVNGKGAKAIKKHRDQDTVTGDIEAGQIVTVIYDLSNTVWQMQSQLAIPGDVTAVANITDNALVLGDGGAKGVKALTLGAADLKLFMNAAGNANEYASGMKIGTFTIDISTTGTQAVTGVGFKGSHVEFIGLIDDSNYTFWGFDDSSLHYSFADAEAIASGTYHYSSSKSIAVYVSAAYADYFTAYVSSWDADGFTLIKAKTGTPTSTLQVIYKILR